MAQTWGIIGTWRMAYEGIMQVTAQLAQGQSSKAAIPTAIQIVEDYPYFKSVGFGGLPNEAGIVQLDAAYMDGDTLAIGGVAGITGFANPILIAKALSQDRFNNLLVGTGAEHYAQAQGFERKEMLTARAQRAWQKRVQAVAASGLSPYDGHDTVCMIASDQAQSVTVGTSTSGLFMKKAGRVGDSPLSGSGFYANSDYGGAAATGLGEDIMKTCVSFETVRYMQTGLPVQEAVDRAVLAATELLATKYGRVGDISVVAMDHAGNYGAATNTTEFSYVVASHAQPATVFLVNNQGEHRVADEAWLTAYNNRIHQAEIKF